LSSVHLDEAEETVSAWRTSVRTAVTSVDQRQLIESLNRPADLQNEVFRSLEGIGLLDLLSDFSLSTTDRSALVWETLYQLGYAGLAGSALVNAVLPAELLLAAEVEPAPWLTSSQDPADIPVPCLGMAPDGFQPVASYDTSGVLLTDDHILVPSGAGTGMTLWLLAARAQPTDGNVLIRVTEPEAVHVHPVRGLGGEPLIRVSFDHLAVAKGSLITDVDPARLAAAHRIMQVWYSAALVGTAQRLLDMALEHVKSRRQFDQSIGAFQAVQHALADLSALCVGARLASEDAAQRMCRGLGAFEAAVAVAIAAEAAESAAVTAAHLHGGVGHIDEHCLPLFFRRAKAYSMRVGPRPALLACIGREWLRRADTSWDGWFG
jgi:alkylation response protein AidB-like acyl-CoA dehydrogenase